MCSDRESDLVPVTLEWRYPGADAHALLLIWPEAAVATVWLKSQRGIAWCTSMNAMSSQRGAPDKAHDAARPVVRAHERAPSVDGPTRQGLPGGLPEVVPLRARQMRRFAQQV